MTHRIGTPRAQAWFEHRQRLFGFGLKRDALGDLGFLPPRCVGAPLLGQVQPAVQEDVHFGGGGGQHSRALAVLDLVRRPALLPFDTDRSPPLLQDPRFVDDPDARRIANSLGHKVLEEIAGGVRIPLHPVQQPLGPIGGGIADRLGHLPAVLAFDRGERPSKILRSLLAGFAAGEQVHKAGVKRSEVVRLAVKFSNSHQLSHGSLHQRNTPHGAR